MNARPLAGKSTTKTPGHGEPGAPKSILAGPTRRE